MRCGRVAQKRVLALLILHLQAHARYCALLLSDYVTRVAEQRLDPVSHACFHALETGLHALVSASTAHELQQMHVNLSTGLGGIRPGLLSQVLEQHEASAYDGHV